MSPGNLANSPQGPPNMVLSCEAKRLERFFRGPIGVADFTNVEVCLPLNLFMRSIPFVGFVVFCTAIVVVVMRRVGTTRHHVTPLVAPLHSPPPCQKQKHGHRCGEGLCGTKTKHFANVHQRMRRLDGQMLRMQRLPLSINHLPAHSFAEAEGFLDLSVGPPLDQNLS